MTPDRSIAHSNQCASACRRILISTMLCLVVSTLPATAQRGLDTVVRQAREALEKARGYQREGLDERFWTIFLRRAAEIAYEAAVNRLYTCNVGLLRGVEDRCRALTEARASYGSDYRGAALYAWENRVGNCNEHGSLVYYILKEAGAGAGLRLIEKDDEHLFVALEVAQGADPNVPSTWGRNAIGIDSWNQMLGPAIEVAGAWAEGGTLFDGTTRREGRGYVSAPWMATTAPQLVPQPPLPPAGTQGPCAPGETWVDNCPDALPGFKARHRRCPNGQPPFVCRRPR